MKSTASVFGWILTVVMAALPCVLAAQTVGTPPAAAAAVYRDKASGDEALRGQDFPAAASFYNAYRKDAEKRGDADAVRDAFECEIDAWILGAQPSPAEAILTDYLKLFPANRLSGDLWKANIRLLRRDPASAKKILTALLPQLADKDPRKFRALAALAAAYELERNYREAAAIYDTLGKTAGEDSKLGRRIAERRILVLAADNDMAAAVELLKNLKLAEDERSLEANKLLNVYLSLKNHAAELVRVSWPEARDADPGVRTDNFFFLAASLIGDEFLNGSHYADAADAYRLAFRCARTKGESFDAVARLAVMLEKLDRKDLAAEIALKQVDLFRSPNASASAKLFAARLFAETGRPQAALDLYTLLLDELKNDPAAAQSVFATAFAQLIHAKDYSAADALIDRHYGKTPSARGTALMRHAETARARGDLKQVVRLSLDAAAADAALAPSAWNCAVEAAAALRDWELVVSVSDRVLAGSPYAPVLFYRAQAMEHLKHAEIARECYIAYGLHTEKVSTESKAEALFRAAALFFHDGKFADSGKYFGKVFEEFPKSKVAPAAGYWQILSCRAADAPRQAEKITFELEKRFPDSKYTGMALLKLADFHKDSGDQKKAGALLNELMNGKTQPAIRAQAFYQKALLACREKNYDEAMTLLQNDDAAGLADAWFLRGDVRKAQNRFPEAMEAYRKAAGLRPGSALAQAALGAEADCHFAVASSQDKTSEFRAALKLYLALLEQKDLLPEFELMTRYKAGRCQQLLGEREAASETYRQLLFRIAADDFAKQPAECFWIVKTVSALELIALKNPNAETIDTALRALSRLALSGVGDRDDLRKRMKTLRKLKAQLISAGENKP